MNTVKRCNILFSLASFLLLAACSLKSDKEMVNASLYQQLLDSLGSGHSTAIYAAAAVNTPKGLWNVYILSAPPDRLIFRQSRQNAEIEFGMTVGKLWRQNVLTGQAVVLSEDWRYFIRSYEIFRLGSQLAKWQISDSPAECNDINADHRSGSDICLIDEYGAKVSIETDDDILPSRIIRELPERFGNGVGIIVPKVWTLHNGELLLTGFQQHRGLETFDWDIQSIRQIPDSEVSIEAPASLK